LGAAWQNGTAKKEENRNGLREDWPSRAANLWHHAPSGAKLERRITFLSLALMR
jgi:hypothetical protein